MLKKLFLEIDATIAGYVGNWAFFIGKCVADGFNERMEEIQEGEQMGVVCEECATEMELEVETPFGNKPVKDHGSN